jgi:hypothetical protein
VLAIVSALAVGGSARAGTKVVSLADALTRELGLTRSASELHEGLAALDRERGSLEYSAGVLDHAGRESMRRMRSYDDVRREREVAARGRARALYKLARGGAARLVFEDFTAPREIAPHADVDRLARGRALQWIVRHDLQVLAVHHRAQQRANAERIAAAREVQAMGAVMMMHAMTEHVLVVAADRVDPALDDAHRERRQAETNATAGQRREHQTSLQDARENWRALVHLRGLEGAARLVRPVGGRLVGPFGAYNDPVLDVPMQRNGVELAARTSEAVRCMAAGRVEHVSSLPGYEQVVVIDHGAGQYSLTARLWRVELQEGQQVEAGAIVGRVAPKGIDDGLGTTVYIELRHGEKPIDPTPYLVRAL